MTVEDLDAAERATVDALAGRDICPECGHVGRFGAITTTLGRAKRCPRCRTVQQSLDDLRMPAR